MTVEGKELRQGEASVLEAEVAEKAEVALAVDPAEVALYREVEIVEEEVIEVDQEDSAEVVTAVDQEGSAEAEIVAAQEEEEATAVVPEVEEAAVEEAEEEVEDDDSYF